MDDVELAAAHLRGDYEKMQRDLAKARSCLSAIAEVVRDALRGEEYREESMLGESSPKVFATRRRMSPDDVLREISKALDRAYSE